MDRRSRNLFAVVLVVVIAVTGGAALILGGGSGQPSPPAGAQTVTGVVTGVDGTGLTDITAFTLRTDGGEIVPFGLSDLRNGSVFAPGHLAEHQALGTRIRVWYVDDGFTRQAVWLEDA